MYIYTSIYYIYIHIYIYMFVGGEWEDGLQQAVGLSKEAAECIYIYSYIHIHI